MSEKTPGNIKYGDMTADFRKRYKQMLEQRNKEKVKNKKTENPLDKITRILYGGNNK